MHAMECNRDEAVRARDIAEKKYAIQDFAGAKKFVLKAQQLFPNLEGLSQMLPVMEVHSVAQAKVGGGEMDWYGLLQVEPGADDSLIKKQYRKLALLLHPDKNKAVGAEAAFKLIGEAWGILSDKTKRHLHDMRRGVKLKVAPRVVPPAEQNVHFPPSYHVAPGAPPSPNPASAFWTSCPRCGMQYQYWRTYENYQLQCPKCKEVFKARDISSSNGGYAYAPYAETNRPDFHFSKMHGAFTPPNGFMNGPFQQVYPTKQPPPSATAGVFSQAAAAAAAASKVAAAAAAAAAASTAVPSNNVAADVVQQTFQKVKRDRVEAEKETKRKEKELRRKESEERRKELRKQREALRHQDSVDRMFSRRRESENRMDSKRKLETKSSRRLKRKKQSSEQEDEESVEEEDFKISEQVRECEADVTVMPRRRSARAKKNISTYKVDNSDSDMEDFPAPKRTKSENEADSEISGRIPQDERSGRSLGSQQTENGGRLEKGKSLAHDEKQSCGIDGGKGIRSDAHGEVREADLDVGEPKDSNNGFSDVPDKSPSKRDTSMRHGEYVVDTHGHDTRGSQKSKTGKGMSKAEPSSTMDEKSRLDSSADQEKRRDVRLEETRDEKSPCKSPSRTLRTRIKTPESIKKPVHEFPPFYESLRRVGKEKEVTSKVEPKPHHSSSTNTSASSSEDDEEHIDVPDPDFNDFDSQRTETDIVAGQVWAIYDDQDGMPRFYARASRVCLSPFKVQMCWLEPTPATEQSNKWINRSGLSVSCGEFKVGKAVLTEQINIFSHLVFDKVGKGPVKIYPRRGEVWATYKDWYHDEEGGPIPIAKSIGEGHTYAYEMVEVLTDYNEEKGCRVVRLAKVKDFKTLFQKIEGSAALKCFRPSELPKFSHCVISERMKGDEALGVPVGSLELDPAATPMDLILGSSAR